MTDSYRDHLAAARLWAANRAPYFATALFALSPSTSPGLGTVGVDANWHLYVDPDAVARWSVEQFGSVLIHETHHVLRAHSERAVAMAVGHQEAKKWNVAADFEINDDISDLPLPGKPLNPEHFGFESGEMAETYYLSLDVLPGVHDCGSGAHGVRGGHEIDDPAVAGIPSYEADLIRQQTARDVALTMNAGGDLPAGLVRWAQAWLHPKIDWRRELAAHVRAGMDAVAGGVDYSYRRPSRRAGTPIGQRVIFPALVQPVPQVAVVIDTSGSMDADALKSSLTEIKGLLRANSRGGARLTVLSCDTQVRNVQSVFTADQVELIGGGGTDMRAAIKSAGELRPHPDVVVVLTDGFTPWPSSRPRAEVVVALIGDGPDPPAWARCVRLPDG